MDIDLMLNKDAKWLAIQSQRPVGEFLKVAGQIDLRQQDWATFWDILGDKLSQIIIREKLDRKFPKSHVVKINGELRRFNDEEMDLTSFLLGKPELEDGVYNFEFEEDEQV